MVIAQYPRTTHKLATAILLLCSSTFSPVSALRGGGRIFGIFPSPDKDKTTTRTPKAKVNQEEDGGSSGDSKTTWLNDLELEGRRPRDHNNVDPNEEGSGVLDALQLHPMLQIPVSFSLNGILGSPHTPVTSYCDTAAMRTVMSWDTAKRLGLLPHLDRRYAGGKAVGVGACRVLGRLPAGLCDLHICGMVTVPSPTIIILESTNTAKGGSLQTTPGVDLLLGLDFLREHQAILDLRQEELRLLVNQEEYSIPFLRPRQPITGLSGGGNGGNRNDGGWSRRQSSSSNFYYYGGEEEDALDDEFIDMSGV